MVAVFKNSGCRLSGMLKLQSAIRNLKSAIIMVDTEVAFGVYKAVKLHKRSPIIEFYGIEGKP